jgi:hypothetical protein
MQKLKAEQTKDLVQDKSNTLGSKQKQVLKFQNEMKTHSKNKKVKFWYIFYVKRLLDY